MWTRCCLGWLGSLAIPQVVLAGGFLAYGPGLGKAQPGVPVPMFVNLSINGQPFRVEIDDASARLIVRVGTDPLEVFLDPRAGSGGGGIWYQSSNTEFSTTVDNADVEMTIYNLRHGVFTPRLFTQTTVRRAGDAKFHSRCEPFVVPTGWISMSADSVAPFAPSEWLLTGTSGPIFDVDAVLFDQMVGGQPFRITATHVGFGDWPDVVVTTVPEPSALILILVGTAAIATLQRSRRNRRPRHADR